MSRRGGWLTLAGVLAIVALAVAAYFTPLMSVRSVAVSGTERLSAQQVEDTAAVERGVPLLQVDTGQIAERIAAIPEVESVRVARSYPSELDIEVVERLPAARVVDEDTVTVLDQGGVGYLEYPADAVPEEFAILPEFVADDPGPSDPTTTAVLGLLTQLPDWLREEMVSLQAASPADIVLNLTEERSVTWGDSERVEEKAEALRHLLTVEGRRYNVSSPDFPAVR